MWKAKIRPGEVEAFMFTFLLAGLVITGILRRMMHLHH